MLVLGLRIFCGCGSFFTRMLGLSDRTVNDELTQPGSAIANTAAFQRLLPDLTVSITQFLDLAEIAPLSRSCTLFNSLVSLKLDGQPSMALARRSSLFSATTLFPRSRDSAQRTAFVSSRA